MKILLANKFFYTKAGAEANFFDASRILACGGQRIVHFSMRHARNLPTPDEKYFVSNVDYEKKGPANAVIAAMKLLYSFEARRKMDSLIAAEKPDIAHLHNIYHQISPSILHSLKRAGIPVVMTLHDYKVVCAQYHMVANGTICEACIGNSYYHCLIKRCIGGSVMRSLLNTAEMYLHHSLLHIYDLVDIFISPSRFLKEEIEKMGFRPRQVVVLPNIVNPAKYRPSYRYDGNSIIYFGRLSEEKGLSTLLEAVRDIKEIRLKIVGEGPMRGALSERIRAEGIGNVSLIDYESGERLKEEINDSLFAVMPSQWYENYPQSVVEAFALGKPVVGSRIGGLPEIVIDGKTGLTFELGNVADLRAKIRRLLDDRRKTEEMGREARAFIERECDPVKYYNDLMEIYGMAREAHRRKGGH